MPACRFNPDFTSTPIVKEACRAAWRFWSINTDRDAPHALMLPTASVRYTLDAANLLDERVRLNGHPLALSAGGELPAIAGAPAAAGTLTFAPATITFLAIAEAGNDACR